MKAALYANHSQKPKSGWAKLCGNGEERRFFALLRTQTTVIDSPISTTFKLNIGGTTFGIDKSIIDKQDDLHSTFLGRFASLEHSDRCRWCTTYLAKSDEYFFERSALLFRPIYNYYLSGICYLPEFGCSDIFYNELDYWGLGSTFKSTCCDLHFPEGASKTTEFEPNPFASVIFGNCRRWVWNVLEEPHSSLLAKLWSMFMLLVLFVTTCTLILGSIEDFQVLVDGSMEPDPVFTQIETVCIVIFTFEYLAKFSVVVDKGKMVLEPMNLIDLLAIGPFYIETGLQLAGIGSEQFRDVKWTLLAMRVLRVMRVVRLLKLGRHCNGLRFFALTLRRSATQLGMTGATVCIGTMFFSTILYFLEKDSKDSSFTSIPASSWWCIVTISTVGYGDMFPQTILGRVVASAAITAGVLVVALPVTIVVQNYMQLREDLQFPKSDYQ